MGRELLTMALCIIGSSLVGLTLAWVYQLIGRWSLSPWLSIAWFHTALATLALLSLPRVRRSFTRGQASWVFGPALLILGGSSLLTLLSGGEENLRFSIAPHSFAWILWIPVIEEVLYRGLLAHEMQRRLGFWLGTYASSLIFALAHTPFPATWSQVLAVPIGPFLLGLACAYVYQRSASLWSPVLLHMSCNATPLIFQNFDPRWLSWLNWLYSKP